MPKPYNTFWCIKMAKKGKNKEERENEQEKNIGIIVWH